MFTFPLRSSYMYTMSLIISPPLLLPPAPWPWMSPPCPYPNCIFSSLFFAFFYNHLCQISASLYVLEHDPIHWSQDKYERPHPERILSFPKQALTSHSSYLGVGPHDAAPPCRSDSHAVKLMAWSCAGLEQVTTATVSARALSGLEQAPLQKSSLTSGLSNPSTPSSPTRDLTFSFASRYCNPDLVGI